MKKLLLTVLLGVTLIGTLSGCTANSAAKNFGGTMNVDVPKGNKFVEATWKDNQLWYTYRPMRDNEVAETFTFAEKSSYGLVEGKVIFKESK